MKKDKKILLWLDDTRNPLVSMNGDSRWLVFSPIEPDKVVWVKSYDEFVSWITNNGLPDAICFDHDLGNKVDPNASVEYYKGEISSYSLLPYDDNEKTGYDCAKWLVDYCIENNKSLPLYNIQSANPVGKENIDNYLKNFIKNYGKNY